MKSKVVVTKLAQGKQRLPTWLCYL